MNKRLWGPIIWTFIHTLSFKIKEESFLDQKNNIFHILKILFSNLPCPYCSLHASKLFKNSNLKLINSKESLIDFLYAFHNQVNRQLKKSNFSRIELDKKYADKDFTKVINNFINVYNNKHTNNLKILITYKTNKKMSNEIVNLILNNSNHYKP